jgi:hypothetical protein
MWTNLVSDHRELTSGPERLALKGYGGPVSNRHPGTQSNVEASNALPRCLDAPWSPFAQQWRAYPARADGYRSRLGRHGPPAFLLNGTRERVNSTGGPIGLLLPRTKTPTRYQYATDDTARALP